jgi:predicted ester cyclase
MSDLNRQIVMSWFEEVWNVGNEGAIDRLMAPDARFHGLPSADGGPVVGPAAFKPFVRTFRSAFPDIRVRVLRTVCERDLVASHCVVTGTHTGLGLAVDPSGSIIQFYGVAIAVIRDGQIQEGWNCFDFLSLYQQVGILPHLATGQ